MTAWTDSDLYINNIGPHRYQLEVSQELIEVYNWGSKKPDPHWFTVDNQGHFHTFADDDSLPTLAMHTKEVAWHCGGSGGARCIGNHAEPSSASYYVCRICSDVVLPSYITDQSSDSDTIPGRKSVNLTVEHFGQNVEIGETVSWYTNVYFGTGKVMSIHLKTGVELLIACDYMAKRKNVDL